MTTVINNPSSENTGGSIGTFMGIVVFLVFVFFLLYVSLPFIKNISEKKESPQINVPEKIDIQVQNPK